MVKKQSICTLYLLHKSGILTNNDIEDLHNINKTIQEGVKDFIRWILITDEEWTDGIKRINFENWRGIKGQQLNIFFYSYQSEDKEIFFSFKSAELGKFQPLKQPAKKKIRLELHPELKEANELLFDYEKEINLYKQRNKNLKNEIIKLKQERNLYRETNKYLFASQNTNKALKKQDLDLEEDCDLEEEDLDQVEIQKKEDEDVGDFDLNKYKSEIQQYLNEYSKVNIE